MMLLSINSGIESLLQFLTALFIFLFVLVITYLTTRYMASLQKNKLKAGNMELIETLRISNNKYLQIVRVGKKYLCMAVCRDTVTMLGELKEEEMVFHENNGDAGMDFQKIFENMKQKTLGNKKQDTNEGKRH